MKEVLIPWAIVTTAWFFLSLACWDVDHYSGTGNPRFWAIAVLTCWAWPLWIAIGIPWLLIELARDAIGREDA